MIARLREHMLSMDGRLGRIRYFKLSIQAGLISIAIFILAILAARIGRPAFFALAALAFAWTFAAQSSIAARRFQDHGVNGWVGASVFLIVTLAGYAASSFPVLHVLTLGLFVYLCLMKGEAGANDFGPDPTPPRPIKA